MLVAFAKDDEEEGEGVAVAEWDFNKIKKNSAAAENGFCFAAGLFQSLDGALLINLPL